jgi:uncharacterized integral membrane protein
MSASTQIPKPKRPKRLGGRGWRELTRTGGPVVLAVLATLFAVLNLGKVKVDWIFGSGHAPLIVVIVLSVLVGAVFMYLAERRIGRRK